MSCCDAPAWVCQFDQKRAAGDLRDYREGGPAATTRALIDALLRAGVEQRTVLDIGGGVGAIQLELLKAGARAATSVDVSAAYIVTLDRVVCCYARMEPLVKASAERCQRLYGLVYPRDQWLTRTVVHTQNFFRGLWRNPFRSFVHSVAAMDALIRSLGFTLRHKVRTFVWEVVVYQRQG